MTDVFKPLHKHLIIRAVVNKTFENEETAKQMLKELVTAVGMVPVTEPQAAYVTQKGNEGLTGSINLATSHCAFHVWDETKLLQFDLYSCKEFDLAPIYDLLYDYFGTLLIESAILLDRSSDFTSVNLIRGKICPI